MNNDTVWKANFSVATPTKRISVWALLWTSVSEDLPCDYLQKSIQELKITPLGFNS